jgi:hypothetical protein
MRSRRRVGLVLAAATAFGAGLIAFSGSAAAAVPTCTPPTTTTNDSCVKLNVTPSNAPDAFTGGQRLFVRTRTIFENPGDCGTGGCAHTVTLDFDNDFKINPGTIPTCSKAQASFNNQDIAGVWKACGPGGTNNAYLSTQVAPTGFGCTANPCVSGQASTVPPLNINACTLLFNGPLVNNQRTITLYARGPETPTDCLQNPATNHNGNTNVVLSGKLSTSPLAGFGRRLTVNNIDTQSPLPLDDFYAYIKRGTYFQARCPAGTSPWRLRGLFVYSGTGQAKDTPSSTQACT